MHVYRDVRVFQSKNESCSVKVNYDTVAITVFTKTRDI